MSRCQFVVCPETATTIISLVPREPLNTDGPEWKFGRNREWRRGGASTCPQAFARAEVCEIHAVQVTLEQNWRLSVRPAGITGAGSVFLERDLAA